MVVQMYEIEYGREIGDPLPGRIMVPEELIKMSLDVVTSGEYIYYKLYRLSPDNVKNNTKGELVEEWERE